MKSRGVQLQHLSQVQDYQEMGKAGVVVRSGTTPRTRFGEATSIIRSAEKGSERYEGEGEIDVLFGAD